ncbi:hypothetical protein F5Y09DRAFT_303399 [Xylaria sp. FL1042]|nr:hypothetical protein F5Y09DRAFT_303399 [Xylaria sp. FL1042]
MNLFWVSDPAVPPNLVRAHVAKNTHAIARRERTARYQALRKKCVSSSSGKGAASSDTQAHVSDTGIAVFTRPRSGSYVEAQVRRSLAVTPSSALDSQIQGPKSQFERFLVKYYVGVIVPFDEDLTNSLNPSRANKTTLLREWLPVALGNPGTQMGLYLCACRSLHARTGFAHYYQHALQYKVACLRLLAESIAATFTSGAPKISDITISTVLQLASDELATGDLLAWRRHINAIDEMVRLSGGLDKVGGMKGLLRKLIEAISSENAFQRTNESRKQSASLACITLETLLQ